MDVETERRCKLCFRVFPLDSYGTYRGANKLHHSKSCAACAQDPPTSVTVSVRVVYPDGTIETQEQQINVSMFVDGI